MRHMIQKFGMGVLQRLEPELSHNLALLVLRSKLYPIIKPGHYQRLSTKLAGMQLTNPVGLAAGFDKNATALESITKIGFGFAEIGAVTPQPQHGNKRPRVFRLPEEEAIINHFGFNNHGMEKINKRLAKYHGKCLIGLNIGANRASSDIKSDFYQVLKKCADNINFATINISSPNTKNLRELQKGNQLDELLSQIIIHCPKTFKTKPIFVKIAPDLEITDLETIANVCAKYNISGIIATNTSNNSRILENPAKYIQGGISGRPLFSKSTKILAQLSKITEGEIPLIGVGGIYSGEDAYLKICAGASAVQLYTALTYKGPTLIDTILKDLDRLLEINGYKTVEEAVGTKRQEFI